MKTLEEIKLLVYEMDGIRKRISKSYNKHSYDVNHIITNLKFLSENTIQGCERVREIKKEIAEAVIYLPKAPKLREQCAKAVLPYITPNDPEKYIQPAAYLEMNSYLVFTYAKFYICLNAALTSKTEQEMFEKANKTYKYIADKNLEKGLISNIALDIAKKDGVDIKENITPTTDDGRGGMGDRDNN